MGPSRHDPSAVPAPAADPDAPGRAAGRELRAGRSITRDRLAGSNAELVEIAVEKLARHGARPARPEEARVMLGLAKAQS